MGYYFVVLANKNLDLIFDDANSYYFSKCFLIPISPAVKAINGFLDVFLLPVLSFYGFSL